MYFASTGDDGVRGFTGDSSRNGDIGEPGVKGPQETTASQEFQGSGADKGYQEQRDSQDYPKYPEQREGDTEFTLPGTARQPLYLNVQQELPNYGTASHWFMSSETAEVMDKI
uniref:Uncharacterized protein n=1 Tax=Magallana gigas TaxID=29159 RepID=K1RJM5_MAGGI